MKQVMVVGCSAYMESCYGCPGEWRCMTAAAVGEGKFAEPSQILAMIRYECPGRATVSNVGLAIKQSQRKPDAIHLAKCMAEAKPDCPYVSAEEMGKRIEAKTGVPVVSGTHEYV